MQTNSGRFWVLQLRRRPSENNAGVCPEWYLEAGTPLVGVARKPLPVNSKTIEPLAISAGRRDLCRTTLLVGLFGCLFVQRLLHQICLNDLSPIRIAVTESRKPSVKNAKLRPRQVRLTLVYVVRGSMLYFALDVKP